MLLKPDTPCKSCVLYGTGMGYVPADGSGENGVLVILESAGEEEAREGVPTVGKAGHYLWSNLARVGINRDGFKIHNVLSCRPPGNKLAKMPYEEKAISCCAPLLDATISEMQQTCRQTGRTFTILALGRVAFKRVMGYTDRDPVMHEDYGIYPHWNERYQAWVVAGVHPSYLLRGNHHELPVLQFAAKRALEIAEHGLTLEQPQYVLDPLPAQFASWVKDYLHAYQGNPDDTYLSYDIETPYKQGMDEGKIAKEEDDDYQILRCSFSYHPGQAVSVVWNAQNLPMLEELFGSPGKKIGWNSSTYDDPRVLYQLPIHGDRLDGMLAWHVLNSSLDKGLGYVTPFYAQTVPMWKHLSSQEPAHYNAADADMALRCWLGIQDDLKRNELWHVYERHVIQLNRVFSWMGAKGVLRDDVMRRDAEATLTRLLDAAELQMDAAVPLEARRLHPKYGYAKTPATTEGLVEHRFDIRVSRCDLCGTEGVTKAHIKPRKKANPCEGAVLRPVEKQVVRWAKPLEFKVSKLQMLNYQKALRHQAIVNRKEEKITFDAPAIERLRRRYPEDPLYPLILEFRTIQKLLTVYIGQTQYQKIEVLDDYQLQSGEKVSEN